MTCFARASSTTPTREPTFALSLLGKDNYNAPVRVNVFSSWHELDETVVSGGARAAAGARAKGQHSPHLSLHISRKGANRQHIQCREAGSADT